MCLEKSGLTSLRRRKKFPKGLDEIEQRLFRIQRVRITKDRPTEEEYFEWLFQEHISCVRDLKRRLTRELRECYTSLPRRRSHQAAYELLNNLYKDLSRDLARDRFDALRK